MCKCGGGAICHSKWRVSTTSHDASIVYGNYGLDWCWECPLSSGCGYLSSGIFLIFQNTSLPHIAWCKWKKLHNKSLQGLPRKQNLTNGSRSSQHLKWQSPGIKIWNRQSLESINLPSFFMCKLYMLLLILSYLGCIYRV